MILDSKKVVMAELSDIRYDARVLKQASTLSRSGYDVSLIMYNSDIQQIEEGKSNGMTTISIPFQKRHYSKTRLQRALRWFIFLIVVSNYFRKIIAMKADYYHAHNFYVGWIVLLSSIVHGGKFIYDIHEIIWDEPGLVYKAGLAVDKLLLPHASLVICPSEDRVKLISDYYKLKKPPLALFNYPRRQSSVLSSTDNFFKKELSLSNGSILLCYTGMFSVKTRLQDNVIKALPHIPEKAVFVIIGFGHPNEITVLEETAKKCNVRERVFILAPKSHAVLMQYTQCCDIGISLIKNLGIGYRYHALNKFYEYVSSGLAVLASNFPTFNHDIYENPVGRIGSTCNEEDPFSIAESIGELIADESRLAALKNNSVQVSRNYWNWEMQEGKLLQAYERL